MFITLDTLRYDAAVEAWTAGALPNLARMISGWEQRHTPASFTYAAHHAFFSGFLPTPMSPGPHPRLFAAGFAGSESTTDETFAFEQATLPEAFTARGYRTICIGGTGFFNPSNELGTVLPSLFGESHWDSTLGVTDPSSAQNQMALAAELLNADATPTFLFMNMSAIHQPNWFYAGSEPAADSLASHTAALVAIDTALPPLLDSLNRRGQAAGVICSDHGTAYGEDGHVGHRHAHPVVWDVPYAEFESNGDAQL